MSRRNSFTLTLKSWMKFERYIWPFSECKQEHCVRDIIRFRDFDLGADQSEVKQSIRHLANLKCESQTFNRKFFLFVCGFDEELLLSQSGPQRLFVFHCLESIVTICNAYTHSSFAKARLAWNWKNYEKRNRLMWIKRSLSNYYGHNTFSFLFILFCQSEKRGKKFINNNWISERFHLQLFL